MIGQVTTRLLPGLEEAAPGCTSTFCGRHVRAYIDLGWDCWVVERNGETIRGSVEICYAAEPAPFGRYAHLELLELSKDLLDDGIQDWILEQCELRARARGFDKFWCRPVGSGDSWGRAGPTRICGAMEKQLADSSRPE